MVAGAESLSGMSGPSGLLKARTGIAGLDQITDGGLPRARTTLVCGGPGSSGVAELDAMLEGGGYYRGSSGCCRGRPARGRRR